MKKIFEKFYYTFTFSILETHKGVNWQTEVPDNKAFQQGLHCLLRKKNQYYLEFITSDPLIYTTDHPKFIVSSQKEESISTQRVK